MFLSFHWPSERLWTHRDKHHYDPWFLAWRNGPHTIGRDCSSGFTGLPNHFGSGDILSIQPFLASCCKQPHGKEVVWSACDFRLTLSAHLFTRATEISQQKMDKLLPHQALHTISSTHWRLLRRSSRTSADLGETPIWFLFHKTWETSRQWNIHRIKRTIPKQANCLDFRDENHPDGIYWDLLGGLKSWVGCWNLDQGWRWGIPSWSTTPHPWRCDERCPLGFGVMHCVIWNLVEGIRFLMVLGLLDFTLTNIYIYANMYIYIYIYM